PDRHEALMRLRSALRRITKSIHVLIAGTTARKRIAVQLRFANDTTREYQITYHAFSRAATEYKDRVQCDCLEKTTGRADRDLRNPAHVRRLESKLRSTAAEAPPPCPPPSRPPPPHQ